MSQPRPLRKYEQSEFLRKLLDPKSEILRSEVLSEVQRLEREISRVWKLVDQERTLAAEFAKQSKKNHQDLLKMIDYYKNTNEWLWKLKKVPTA